MCADDKASIKNGYCFSRISFCLVCKVNMAAVPSYTFCSAISLGAARKLKLNGNCALMWNFHTF